MRPEDKLYWATFAGVVVIGVIVLAFGIYRELHIWGIV